MRTINSIDELNIPVNHKLYLKRLLKYFKANPKIEKVFLFGSCAKGTATAKSDIDLFLLGQDINDDDEWDIAWNCPKWDSYIACDILSGTHKTYAEMSQVPGMVQYAVKLLGVDISGL